MVELSLSLGLYSFCFTQTLYREASDMYFVVSGVLFFSVFIFLIESGNWIIREYKGIPRFVLTSFISLTIPGEENLTLRKITLRNPAAIMKTVQHRENDALSIEITSVIYVNRKPVTSSWSERKFHLRDLSLSLDLTEGSILNKFSAPTSPKNFGGRWGLGSTYGLRLLSFYVSHHQRLRGIWQRDLCRSITEVTLETEKYDFNEHSPRDQGCHLKLICFSITCRFIQFFF